MPGFDKTQWYLADQNKSYETVIAEMELAVSKVIDGSQADSIFLAEHEDVITAGTGTNPSEIPGDMNIIYSGRGGRLTYHGRGQRVIYPVIDLNQAPWNKDLKKYINFLHSWIIATLNEFGIYSFRREDHVGIWTKDYAKSGNNHGHKLDKKIAAIGIRARKWVVYHGVAVNLTTNLNKYNNFTPCGISDLGVTSAEECGKVIKFTEFDETLKRYYYIEKSKVKT
ncbi:MAG: lipoyl(octanoyl) transferase LipB [Rickettsiaceae bacterium]|nr:lipoyl(octanoyl) transferase LipB [Rickettsiaceae bacterium]